MNIMKVESNNIIGHWEKRIFLWGFWIVESLIRLQKSAWKKK